MSVLVLVSVLVQLLFHKYVIDIPNHKIRKGLNYNHIHKLIFEQGFLYIRDTHN